MSAPNPTVNKPTNGREVFEYVQKKLTEIKNINKTLFKQIGQLEKTRSSGGNGKFKVKRPKTYDGKVSVQPFFPASKIYLY